MDSLRVGVVAPPWFAVPPKGYGGTELVVSNLVEGLTARGHDVTLFASGGSRTSARLVTTFDQPPSEALGDGVVEGVHLLEAYAHAQDFDIIHDHTMLGLLTAAKLQVPVVHTVHGAIDARLASFYERVPRSVHIIAISHHHRSTFPPGIEPTVIHNGTDLAGLPFSYTPGGYLLFVGRANADKGPLEAIEIARRAGMPLLMLCKVNELNEHEYFDQVLAPALSAAGDAVDLRLQVTAEEKAEAYAGAFATLFPIRWPEPFGLVMTESMAAGTPVIAFRRGAAPEVVEHGRTGFVVDTVDEAVAALEQVPGLSRYACRERVETQFGARLNVLRHEALYRRILGIDEEVTPAVGVTETSARVEPGEEAAAAS